MKISEVHTRLDRRCVIAIRQHGGIFDIISKLDMHVPAYVFYEGEKIYLQMFFQKTIKQNPALSPVLSRKDLVEKRSYNSISERINNVESMKVISKLLEVSSVALNNVYIIMGELFFDFRFHSSRLHEINDILSEVIGLGENFRMVKMTFSRSLRERNEELHSSMPLAVVRYSVPVPQDSEISKYMKENHPDSVAEIEGSTATGSGNDVKVLFYTSTPVLLKGIDIISERDHVYQLYVFEKTLAEGRRRGNEARIPRIAFFLTFDDGRLTDTTFVPAAEADEYVRIMMTSLMVDHETHPLLEYYSVLDEKIWEWI